MENNNNLSRQLSLISQILKIKGNKIYQSKAYKKASKNIAKYKKDICLVSRLEELESLSGVGQAIAKEIFEFCQSGRIQYLKDLFEKLSGEEILTLSGIGKGESKKLAFEMNISNLEEFLLSYKKGYIVRFLGKDSVEYLNIKRLLEEVPSWCLDGTGEENVSVEKILNIDSEFREKNKMFRMSDDPSVTVAIGNTLYSVSYSHSEAAYLKGAIGDWVNIKSLDSDSHWTVVTSQYGSLKGRRVVMGRIKETQKYYNREKRSEEKTLSA